MGMLTKNDLGQIGQLIRSETRTIVKEELKTELHPIKGDVRSLKEDMTVVKSDIKTLKEDVRGLKKDMKTVKSDIVKVRKDINMVISFFDRDYVNLRQRVDRIEDHLGIQAQ